VDDAQLALARQLMENKAAAFDPAAFTDRYQAALLETIKAKVNGGEPVQVSPAPVGQIVNLIEALKASVAETAKVAPARLPKARKTKAALAA
jgi:DNA end-binding protein Ku